MNGVRRLFMDVSYTRTQRVSVGITRTVRRLEEELRRLQGASGGAFSTVSFHSRGFREMAPAAFSSPGPRGAPSAPDNPAAGLFRWITGAFFRKVVLTSLFLPWAWVQVIWSLTSRWTFNFLTRSEPAVVFRPGDVLLLCDASWNYPVWLAARAARAQGASVVLLMYDLIPLRHPNFCFALVPPIFRLWLDRMLPNADAVICISDATEQDLRAYSGETGLSLPPTGHFRLGSDPVRGPTANAHVGARVQEFLTSGPACFAAIGSFEPKKNYGFMLDVFERLWARGLDLRLLIVGRESAESRDLVQRVRCHAEQGRRLLSVFEATDAEVTFVYANCRALVFPSLAEGFGLPLVEARTRGCLVIASSLPALVELADEGVCIYPQGSHQALEQLLLEHAAADHRAQTPPMKAFTWSDSAAQLLELSKRLLATSTA
jgi:glycosyltransferase involved in cell wall biosynthesis